MKLDHVMPRDSLSDLLLADNLEEIALRVRCLNRRIVAVEGCMGAGKSTLAAQLAGQLSIPWVALDDYLPEDAESARVVETMPYVQRLDRRGPSS